MENLKQYEKELSKNGFQYIGGVDEAGRGPLVGPVVAACCVLPSDFKLDGLTDSKKLSEKKRNIFFDYIKEHAVTYGIGIVEPDIIDEINILQASKLAMVKAIDACHMKPDYLIIDGNQKIKYELPMQAIVKGDSKSISIAAASVLAKVTRDKMLYELDEKYPMYGFKNHKGYPTKQHLLALKEYGLIEGYRKSYGPVKEILGQINQESTKLNS